MESADSQLDTEILRHALRVAAEEASIVVVKSAHSAMIVEGSDACAGILDRDARLVALSTATNLGFSTMSNKANEWGVPLFLGEFGAFEDTFGVESYMDLQYEKLDEFFASGTQWNWTPSWTPPPARPWPIPSTCASIARRIPSI